MIQLLSAAYHRITLRVMLLQVFGNIVLLGLALGIAEMPDSYGWEVALSALLVILLFASAFALHAIIVRRLRHPAQVQPLRRAGLLLALWTALYWLTSYVLDPLNDRASQRASYWNALLGPSLRRIFTYDHLLAWQNFTFNALINVVLPLLLLPVAIETVSRGFAARRNVSRVLYRWQYWLTALLASFVCVETTNLLLGWHPATGVTGEIVSIILRGIVVYVVAAFLLTFVIAMTAELLARNNAGGNSAP